MYFGTAGSVILDLHLALLDSFLLLIDSYPHKMR